MAKREDKKLTTSRKNIIQDINAIKVIDIPESKPDELDFRAQDRLYGKFKEAISAYIPGWNSKAKVDLGKFQSWLEFPVGTPSQKTVNFSSNTLADGGKLSDGSKVVRISVLQKTLNLAYETKNPSLVILNGYWQSIHAILIQSGSGQEIR